MTKRSLLLWLAVSAVAAAMAAVLMFGNQHAIDAQTDIADADSGPESLRQTVPARLQSARENTDAGQIVTTPNDRIAGPTILGESDPTAILRRARTAHEALNALLPMAQQGNGAAAAAIQVLRSRCSPFNPMTPNGPPLNAPAGSADRDAQEALLQRLAAYCNDPRIHSEAWPELRDRLARVIRSAAANGDEAAIAADFGSYFKHIVDQRQLTAEQQSEMLWHMAARARNPELLVNVLNKLAAVTPNLGQDAIGVQSWREWDTTLIRTLAVDVLACEHGALCGPYESVYMQGECLHARNCAMHLTLPEFVRQRALSAAQYEAMLRYIEFLRTEIDRRRD